MSQQNNNTMNRSESNGVRKMTGAMRGMTIRPKRKRVSSLLQTTKKRQSVYTSPSPSVRREAAQLGQSRLNAYARKAAGIAAQARANAARAARAARAATVIKARLKGTITRKKIILSLFKRDLQSNLETGNSEYYGNLIDKIIAVTPLMIKNLPRYRHEHGGQNPTYKNFKSKVDTHIGQCHVSPTNLPLNYLKYMINALYDASKKYHALKPSEKNDYMVRAAYNLKGNPCIENFLESIQSSFYEPAMNWLGTSKKFTPLRFPADNNNKNRYLNTIAMAIGSYITPNTRLKLQRLKNNKERINRFWNIIKLKQLSAVNSNGNPMFIAVKNYNTNGKIFKKSGIKAANYVTKNQL